MLARARTGPPVVAAGALGVAALGEEVEVPPPPGDGLADQLLGVAVALGGVDDVEAGVERLLPADASTVSDSASSKPISEPPKPSTLTRNPVRPSSRCSIRLARSAGADTAHAARRSSRACTGVPIGCVGLITTSQPAGT